MYKLKLTRREKKELAWGKWIVSVLAVLGLAAVVYFAWVRPAQQDARVNSYQDCVAAGNPIQESYPEVCLTEDGKRFVNPQQQAAHDASLAGQANPVAPTDPSLLYMDIKEWSIRVPLTSTTFDLVYTYMEDGLNDRVRLNYKRLINEGICTSDIGVTLSRSTTQYVPPYTANNPAPLAFVDRYYYYASVAGEPCYDKNNSQHMVTVSDIAGDKTLTQATTDLLSGIKTIPGTR